MAEQIDEATAQFVEAAAVDLERHLPASGIVEGLWVTAGDGDVQLTARFRFENQTFEFDGSGDSLLTAYASLRAHLPEARLVAAFREMLDQPSA